MRFIDFIACHEGPNEATNDVTVFDPLVAEEMACANERLRQSCAEKPAMTPCAASKADEHSLPDRAQCWRCGITQHAPEGSD